MIAELQPYSVHKPLQYGLFESVPESWRPVRLKFVMPHVTVGIVITPSKYYVDEGVPAIRSLNVKDGRLTNEDLVFFSEEDNQKLAKTRIYKDDVVIVRTGQTGACAVVDGRFDGANCIDLIIVRKSQHLRSKFLQYFLASREAAAEITMSSNGAIQQHFNIGLVREITLLQPRSTEQDAIIAFLDRETAKIDRLMDVRKRQVETLQEQRIAIIHHAVTKGLDSNPKMKPSGIEWLDEIPKGWVAKRLKYVAACNHATLGDDVPANFILDYVDIGSVTSRGEILEIQTFELKDAPSRARRKLREGSVVISTVRTYLKTIAFFDNPATNLIVSTGFAVLDARREEIRPRFLYHAVASEYFVQRVIAQSKGVGYPAIDASDLVNIAIAFPDLEEQDKILIHIATETSTFDALIDKYNNELKFLAEYRASLISHAVTGKIDVRELVKSA